jgi:predicted RNA-binding protein YlxR (DUF448 family)
MKEKKVLRRCAISKIFLLQDDLFRIVRTPDGKVLFQKEVFLTGRGVHFTKEKRICEQIFSQKNKKSMLSILLKIPLSEKDILILKEQVFSALENEK